MPSSSSNSNRQEAPPLPQSQSSKETNNHNHNTRTHVWTDKEEEALVKRLWNAVRQERDEQEYAHLLERLEQVEDVLQQNPPPVGLEQVKLPSIRNRNTRSSGATTTRSTRGGGNNTSTTTTTTTATTTNSSSSSRSKKASNNNNPPSSSNSNINNNSNNSTVVKPVTLSGARDPVPPHTARIFVSQPYPVSDSPELNFVPSAVGDAGAEQSQIDDYFKLFDVAAREQAIVDGPLYHVQAMNGDVKETMRRCWKEHANISRDTLEGVLAVLANLEDERVEILYQQARSELEQAKLPPKQQESNSSGNSSSNSSNLFQQTSDKNGSEGNASNTSPSRIASPSSPALSPRRKSTEQSSTNQQQQTQKQQSRNESASPSSPKRGVIWSPPTKPAALATFTGPLLLFPTEEKDDATKETSTANATTTAATTTATGLTPKPTAAPQDKPPPTDDGYTGPFCQPVKHPTLEGNDPQYLELVDSYRKLYCSRCRLYDCLIHGMTEKPSLQLSYEIGIGLEREPKSRSQGGNRPVTTTTATNPTGEAADEVNDTTNNVNDNNVNNNNSNNNNNPAAAPLLDREEGKQPSIISEEEMQMAAHDEDKPEAPDVAERTELTPFQKTICKRFMLIFEGNVAKMATCMRAPRALVQQYMQEQGWDAPQVQKPDARLVPPFKPDSHYHSLRNYNVKWYTKIAQAGLRPAFEPCVHDEPCKEGVCICVTRHVFCTSACAWNSRSRNFYRGCDCRSGCNTNTCSCFSNSRECDPDLCRCDTCTDPAGKARVRQKCNNDSVTMKRAIEIVIGPSGIPNAGWGAFVKRFIPKGTFLGEYVGEMISQEEADRRGQLYDIRNHSSLFMLSADVALDADRKGNLMRYINHSALPNTTPRTVTVNGDNRIGFFALQDIEAQQELTFNYGYNFSVDNDYILKSAKAVPWMDLSPDGTTVMQRAPNKRKGNKKGKSKASSSSASSSDDDDLVPMDIMGEISGTP